MTAAVWVDCLDFYREMLLIFCPPPFVSVRMDKVLQQIVSRQACRTDNHFISLKNIVCVVFRPKKATRKQWRRRGKNTRGATSPRPSSPSTSSGRTTGYGKISGTEKKLLSQRAVRLTHQESQQSTKPQWIFTLIRFIYIYNVQHWFYKPGIIQFVAQNIQQAFRNDIQTEFLYRMQCMFFLLL